MKHIGKSIIISALICLLPRTVYSQNREFAQQVIDTLGSEYFFGRGYLKEGSQKTAAYLRESFSKAGLLPLAGDYYQYFNMDVNTYYIDPIFSVNNENLTPGKDYVMEPSSCSVHRSLEKFIWVDRKFLSKKRNVRRLLRKPYEDVLIILDTLSGDPTLIQRRNEIKANYKGTFLIEMVNKLTWGVSRTVSTKWRCQVIAGKLNRQIPEIFLKIFNRIIGQRPMNVHGYFEGTEKPDSFIVFCAHYDHLGGIGDSVFFPGANDNASGIAMMLDMVNYFKLHPPRYSVAFIAFAAEEAGLVGSYFWVINANKFIPLNQIRFLINMDLMGSGDEGIMAVNGAVFTESFQLLENINNKEHYLPQVKARGKAANSDHYFFTEKGVECFFFYLMGKYQHYHDIDDNPKNLRLTEYYDRSFSLIVSFAKALMNQPKEN